MLAMPGIALLIIFIYARPQEFFSSLRVVPFLYVFLGLSLFGCALDLRLRNTRLRGNPLLPWIVAFFGWSALTLLIHAPGAISAIFGLAICVTLYALIAHGIQSFRALQ